MTLWRWCRAQFHFYATSYNVSFRICPLCISARWIPIKVPFMRPRINPPNTSHMRIQSNIQCFKMSLDTFFFSFRRQRLWILFFCFFRKIISLLSLYKSIINVIHYLPLPALRFIISKHLRTLVLSRIYVTRIIQRQKFIDRQ